MTTLYALLKMAAVLIAAVLMGNWYQTTQRKMRAAGQPWYALYKTWPGIIIVFVIILLPVILWWIKK